MKFTFSRRASNVSYLEAPYELLVKAFGNDGTVSIRDDSKSMCEWDIKTPYGDVEVYDYKVGICYARDGLPREQITTWCVQGDDQAVDHVLAMLERTALTS